LLGKRGVRPHKQQYQKEQTGFHVKLLAHPEHDKVIDRCGDSDVRCDADRAGRTAPFRRLGGITLADPIGAQAAIVSM
jgi:hypothetical protein